MGGLRILVLGAGGVGGYFGGRLAQAGVDVTFLVRERRLRRLNAEGLRIRSPFGDAAIAVKAVAAAEDGGRFDAVLLACKAYDLEDAISTVAPAVSDGCAVLPLLNGVAHIDRLNAAFGAGRVLGGLAKIQATLTEDGVVEHFNDWRFLTFGEQDGRMTGRVAALEAAFAQAPGCVAEAVPDVMRRLWEKLVHVATSAGMTCLMRANVGEIVRTADGAALLRRLLEANAEIAARLGHAPSPAFMETYRATFSDPSSGYSTSMLRDIERGAPTEGDHILGFMLDSARSVGVSEPILELACAHVQGLRPATRCRQAPDARPRSVGRGVVTRRLTARPALPRRPSPPDGPQAGAVEGAARPQPPRRCRLRSPRPAPGRAGDAAPLVQAQRSCPALVPSAQAPLSRGIPIEAPPGSSAASVSWGWNSSTPFSASVFWSAA
ncbi:2-dehydropantoate 2-reductase [Rubrimonas cliftonensis]|uniref:2-dehydropantoate 2-reductase n=1 Tax=Rubrimonas cliftonensis TaxID=89524 RepID=A0A1H3YFI8_9RHOB|nr:2-dehydropantoate 2-reductase [Rubrimonas cliftonensis]SEA10370.1 2-dehydropantoate 2-reductase [Rubrimonas cliftonensis]